MLKSARVLFSKINQNIVMNRKLLPCGIAIAVFALNAICARGQSYEFAVVSNSITAGASLGAAANNGNTFVCVGVANSPVLTVNTNNFANFAAGNFNGGYLLVSNAWTNTLKSAIKYNWLNCVASQPGGFVASGASNTVYVSSDGINWKKWGSALGSGETAYSVDGIAYNSFSSTFAAALSVYEMAFMTNPIASNVWQVAHVNNQSFAESFRGVTTFASSNMAVCGILGDIRVSPDGGLNWNEGQPVNLKLPNLVSVASDGASNLVCAGDLSTIEVSTHGGTTGSWNFQTSINAGGGGSTNFNAVAYSSAPNAFLAVGTLGADGLIVMATNSAPATQWAWTGQTNLWALQGGVFAPVKATLPALYGDTFANTNFFQGIGMIVGTNGAVIIAGFPPLAPTNSAGNDITNVLTNPQTNALVGSAVDVVTNTYSPANVLGFDWYSAKTNGIELATNSFAFRPPASLYSTCGVYTVWAQERDLRSGFASTTRTPFDFTIIPGPPTDPVSSTNCDPIGRAFGMCPTMDMFVTVVTNAENPPGTILVNWYDSNSNLVVDADGVNGDTSGFVPILSPGTYTFYAQATNPASGFASTWVPVTLQINPLPQWTSTTGFFTNVIFSTPEINPAIQAPSLTNAAAIATFEPGSTIVYDWYTNVDPTASTFENANPPYAYGASGVGSNVNPFTPTNRTCGSYSYFIRARVIDPGFTSCSCQSIGLIPVVFQVLPPAPEDASVGLTNVLTGAPNLPISVDVAVNSDNPASSFRVNWYAASNDVNNIDSPSDSSVGNTFSHIPTNTMCGVFTNWAEVTATAAGLTSPSRTPVVFAIIPAAPSAVGSLDATNCTEVPNPTFTVSVTNGQTANWFAVPSGGTPLTNALSLIPPVSTPGTWTFAAQAVDPLSGLSSTGSAIATLTLSNCSSPLTINMNAATGTGTIQWPGDLVLLSSSNLVDWTIVSTGSVFVAPNTLSWTNTNPPIQFFRLTN